MDGYENHDKKTLIAVFASHDSAVKNNELARIFEELYHRDDGNSDEDRLLGRFHFLMSGGTFSRLIRGQETFRDQHCFPVDRIKKGRHPASGDFDAYVRNIYPIEEEVKDFLLRPGSDGAPKITVLPEHSKGGVAILANLVVQQQCSIIWPILSPFTEHWLHPENLALLRLCDLWKAKRLMNAQSVRKWFQNEAERDVKRNPQEIPLRMCMGTPAKSGGSGKNYTWPRATDRTTVGDRWAFRLNLDQVREKEIDQGTIALIAHDAMKSRMVDFAIQYEKELSKYFDRILATGTTGQEVEGACRRLKSKIVRCRSGPRGGDIEVAMEILFGRCGVVIFFVDPMNPHPHIDDIRVVFGACMAEILDNNVQMLTNEVQAREWMEETYRRR